MARAAQPAGGKWQDAGEQSHYPGPPRGELLPEHFQRLPAFVHTAEPSDPAIFADRVKQLDFPALNRPSHFSKSSPYVCDGVLAVSSMPEVEFHLFDEGLQHRIEHVRAPCHRPGVLFAQHPLLAVIPAQLPAMLVGDRFTSSANGSCGRRRTQSAYRQTQPTSQIVAANIKPGPFAAGKCASSP